LFQRKILECFLQSQPEIFFWVLSHIFTPEKVREIEPIQSRLL
jgi:hypothetical protein